MYFHTEFHDDGPHLSLAVISLLLQERMDSSEHRNVSPMDIRNSRFRIVLRTSSLEIIKRTCCLFVNVFILRRLSQRCRVLASSSTRGTFHYSNDQAVVKEKHFLQNNIGKGGKRKLHTQSNLQRVIWIGEATRQHSSTVLATRHG